MSKKIFPPILSAALLLSGCLTLSGNYTVDAYDANGKLLSKYNMSAQGSGIYTVRNALCHAFPKAIVVIKDIKTGDELKSESPYRCK